MTVGPDQTREFRVLLTAAKPPDAAATPVTFALVGSDDQTAATARDFFRAGGP